MAVHEQAETTSAESHGDIQSTGLWPVIRSALWGDLHDASQKLVHGGYLKTLSGRLTARWLNGLQCREAKLLLGQAAFEPALETLADAFRVSSRRGQKSLVTLQSRIIVAIDKSTSDLFEAGDWKQSLQLLRLLARGDLLSPQGAELLALAIVAEQADWHAQRGETSAAVGLYRQIQLRAPDLNWIAQKIRQIRPKADGMGDETVRELNSNGLGETRRSLGPGRNGSAVPPASAANPLHQAGPPRFEMDLAWTGVGRLVERRSAEASDDIQSGQADPTRLMLWIDGVGHYLLCLEPQIWLGRYVPLSGIQIPVLADLHRRHLRLSRDQQNRISLQAFAATTVVVHRQLEGSRGVELADKPVRLNSGRSLQLGESTRAVLQMSDSVQWQCRQAGQDASLVLEPISHHRTVPACTAVVWFNRKIVFGPDDDADIRLGPSFGRVELEIHPGGLRCTSQLPIHAVPWDDRQPLDGGENLRMIVGGAGWQFERLESDQEIPAAVAGKTAL